MMSLLLLQSVFHSALISKELEKHSRRPLLISYKERSFTAYGVFKGDVGDDMYVTQGDPKSSMVEIYHSKIY